MLMFEIYEWKHFGIYIDLRDWHLPLGFGWGPYAVEINILCFSLMWFGNKKSQGRG